MEDQDQNQGEFQAEVQTDVKQGGTPEKEIGDVRKITGELIGGFFIYGIVFGIIYSIIASALFKKMFGDSLVWMGIAAVVCNGIVAFLVWKLSASSTFKKRSINASDIPQVMKNILIFTIIICLLSALLQFADFKQKVDKIEESYMRLTNTFASMYSDNEYFKDLQTKQKEEIKKAERPFYIYLGIMEVGITAVYIGVLPLLKKEIQKYAV